MPAKGEFEIQYFGGPDNPASNGGVNYSVPYTALPSTDLAPGTINTHSIRGLLTSSPWVSSSPFNFNPGSVEYFLGTFEFTGFSNVINIPAGIANMTVTIFITNLGVYVANGYGFQGTTVTPPTVANVHSWSAGDINGPYLYPGQAVTFLQLGSVVYFTGLMLRGIYLWSPTLGFRQATNYVAGRFLSELSGRMVVAECHFPGGGGTGVTVQPTVAWSGVGIYGQAWDGTGPNDVWNPLNQTNPLFNGNIGGFNPLSDVPDQITGLGLVGQSLIIFRNNGITQQDPNSTYSNSGIQPYNWYHMWSSQQGVGAYPGTVSQFGQMLIFKSSDNIYSLSMSGGLSQLGNKIMGKIDSDLTTARNAPGVFATGIAGSQTRYLNSWWYFSSIYPLDGQLHYLLVFSSYTTDVNITPSQQITSCVAYDMNMAEGSWHAWDFSSYFLSTGLGSGFIGCSCPPVMQWPTIQPFSNGDVQTVSNPRFLFFGGFTTYGIPFGAFPQNSGNLFSLNSFNYDNSTPNNYPPGGYLSSLYPVISQPSTTIVFRGEVVSLGHKISVRRLRILAANSGVFGGAFEMAFASFQGESSTSTSTSVIMAGNGPFTGAEIRTYYFDVVISDYTVQPSLKSVINPSTPWVALCAFRIASASLIGIDTTSTTQ